MKRFLFALIVLTAIMTSCASTPVVTLDSKTTFAVKFVKGDKEFDGTCSIGIIKDTEGLILDSFCTGFFSDDTGTYRCEVAVGSDKLPVTKRIDVTQNCKLDIAK